MLKSSLPVALSAGLIFEEGLPIADLGRTVRFMQAAAKAAGVQIVTGDTKLVDRANATAVSISGIGLIAGRCR